MTVLVLAQPAKTGPWLTFPWFQWRLGENHNGGAAGRRFVLWLRAQKHYQVQQLNYLFQLKKGAWPVEAPLCVLFYFDFSRTCWLYLSPVPPPCARIHPSPTPSWSHVSPPDQLAVTNKTLFCSQRWGCGNCWRVLRAFFFVLFCFNIFYK